MQAEDCLRCSSVFRVLPRVWKKPCFQSPGWVSSSPASRVLLNFPFFGLLPMSLLKQLLISVSLAVCVILAGTLWFALDGARSYLNDRLRVDAENAASSLALSLSQPSNQDPVTQELLMTALFDSGQYRSIVFTTPAGEVAFLRERGVEARTMAAPGWFQAWLPLTAPTAARAVSDGWKQAGEVAVTPEDSFAWRTLWRMTWQVLLLVIGAGLLWAIFAVFLIRWLKRALQSEVAEQVQAIAEGGVSRAAASPQGRAPRVKELAQVRTVIESVRERVRATADEQNRHIETLRIELNTDPITGVANRKYFLNELRRALRAGGGAHAAGGAYGHVLIFRQRDLAAINASLEREQADAWLRGVVNTVTALLAGSRNPDRPVPQLARLNGSDFVVLLVGYDGPDTTDLIQALRQALDTLRVRVANDRLCRWSYALTDYGPGCDVGRVLARLDHGLMRAENAGHDEVEYIASSDYRVVAANGGTGETAWKELIQAGLREGRLTLSVQEARYRGDDTDERHEALLMLGDASDSATAISGYLFMPPAVRLGLSGACDLRAIELGAQWVRDHAGELAVRVSLASLLQPDFLPGMERILTAEGRRRDDLRRLVLEIDAHGFVAYPEELQAFCGLAARAGVGVGLRRLAEQPAALLRLHRVGIRYIKLGGELISDLLESPGATQLIVAITEAAIGQGVKVYAHDVSNGPTAALLLEYGVLLPESSAFPPRDDEGEGAFVDH